MRIALIADTFPPARNSGAVQLRDLAREFVRQGHAICVMLPATEQNSPWKLERIDGIQVLRLYAPKTKDVGLLRRTLAEILMPFFMLINLKKSPMAEAIWDGIVWYSPSIFHTPLVHSLKKSSHCKSYLIIRDIFPEWAADMGMMRRGALPYRFFNAMARYQYSIADVIGIQTNGNRHYFTRWLEQSGRRLEVLQNWLAAPATLKCSIQIALTSLAGKKIFVYAGNMGVAQGLDIILDLAEKLRNNTEYGFLFVGRGSEAVRLKAVTLERAIENVLFFDEIDPDEIPSLYAQCAVGIVALDPRHKSHNIPGKFITYMQNGLPVLANVNSGNDLAELIRKEGVGQVCESNNVDELLRMVNVIGSQLANDASLSARCTALFEREFSVKTTVAQLVASLSNH